MGQKSINVFHVMIDRPRVPPTFPRIFHTLCPGCKVSAELSVWLPVALLHFSTANNVTLLTAFTTTAEKVVWVWRRFQLCVNLDFYFTADSTIAGHFKFGLASDTYEPVLAFPTCNIFL